MATWITCTNFALICCKVFINKLTIGLPVFIILFQEYLSSVYFCHRTECVFTICLHFLLPFSDKNGMEWFLTVNILSYRFQDDLEDSHTHKKNIFILAEFVNSCSLSLKLKEHKMKLVTFSAVPVFA